RLTEFLRQLDRSHNPGFLVQLPGKREREFLPRGWFNVPLVHQLEQLERNLQRVGQPGHRLVGECECSPRPSYENNHKSRHLETLPKTNTRPPKPQYAN